MLKKKTKSSSSNQTAHSNLCRDKSLTFEPGQLWPKLVSTLLVLVDGEYLGGLGFLFVFYKDCVHDPIFICYSLICIFVSDLVHSHFWLFEEPIRVIKLTKAVG